MGVIGNLDDILVDDIVYLVDYLFRGGSPPPCVEQGNTDGIGNPTSPIDVADATYLVAFLFQGGPAPPSCEIEKFSTPKYKESLTEPVNNLLIKTEGEVVK